MGITEIRESGLLELYVIGGATTDEIKIVEQALIDYPQLKEDLYEIGGALEVYAKVHQVEPSEGVKEKILKQVSSSRPITDKSSIVSVGIPSWITYVLAALAGLMFLLYFSTNSKHISLQTEFEKLQIDCDSIQQASEAQYAVLEQLQSPNNEILAFSATEKFEQTELSLIYNAADKQNFIQVKNIPSISNQESYQLWSLKPGVDPIPLTVFQGDEGLFIPVSFEDGTATYAITIENLGGAQSPNLDNLIGTVNVPS